MTWREETQHPTVVRLVTGHFHESAGYQNWRARGTGDWLLIYTVAGAGRFGSACGDLTARPGDIILLRPGTPHDYGTAPGAAGWELLWSHFHPRPEWEEWLRWPEHAPGLMRLTLAEPILRQKVQVRFLEAHRLATGGLRQRALFAMNALEEVLLWCDTQNPRSEQARLDARVRDAMDYLCHHLGDQIPMEVLAGRVGLSVSRLAHLFRAQAGQTPQQFLEAQRLARAKQLLELTPRTVGEIATEVGYENPFYFTLRFKRQTGLSPRDWRQRLNAADSVGQ